MYKNQEQPIGTKPISVRIRRDVLDWMEVNCINKNAFINQAVESFAYRAQRLPELPQWMLRSR